MAEWGPLEVTKAEIRKMDVGNHRIDAHKSSVEHLTPQFKQTNNEVLRSAMWQLLFNINSR